MNGKYSTREVQKLLNITDYELNKLRKNGTIQYEKVGGRYQYELTEELKKSFLPEPEINTNLSTTTDDEHVEKTFNNSELELPQYQQYSIYRNSRKTKSLQKFQERDSLIEAYRAISEKPEVEGAIDEIVNEFLSVYKDGDVVKVDFLDSKEIGDKTKTIVIEAFKKILKLLDFYSEGDEIIKDWYRDGFIPFEIVYNNKKVNDGIQDIIQMSPFKLKKVRNISTGEFIYTYDDTLQEFEIYSKDILKDIPVYEEEQIVIPSSGKLDPSKTYWASYLRPALKPINDLAHIENSLVIYRLTKAGEKNIWNIDVGNMAGQKAKQHLASVAQDIKTNIKYNTETGMTSSNVSVGIQSDWIFPTRNGKQKTEVNTIDGNSDFISKLDDLNYFRRKVNEALKIPVGRLDKESTLDFSSEDILREELKFTMFIRKLRRRFSNTLFIPLLHRELISTKKITEDEWNKIKQLIVFKWNDSNAIVAKAEVNNTKTKLEAVSDIEDSGLIGKYISIDYVYKHILQMSKEEYDTQKKLIQQEKDEGMYDTEDDS